MKGNLFKTLALIILPVVVYLVGNLYIVSYGTLFLRSVDPEYAYLFNGLILAHFGPDVQYIEHPGTPVQCLVAIISWVLHLFRPGQSLANDVLRNPELYIRATLYSVNIINAVVVFLLGYYAYQYSRNLIVAVFLQLTPLTHQLTLEVIGRMMPELIMNSIVCCWVIVVIKLIYQDEERRNYKRYSLIFAILIGMGIADKLTFAPYFLFPLILLPSWKFRLRYTLLSLISFLFFAFPVIMNSRFFLQWVTNIFIHTGSYGGGERGILNWNGFFTNLKFLADNTRFLLVSIIILLIVTFFYAIRKRKKKLLPDLNISIIIGLSAVFFLQYFMTAKHFAFHYMIPSILLTAFVIFMISLLLNRMIPAWQKMKTLNALLGIIGIGMLISIATKTVKQLKLIREDTACKTTAYNQILPFLKASPKIIVPSYYGCSAVEYALTFGLQESHKHGNFLSEKMKKLYPSTFLYFPWGKVFYEGNKEILPSSFIHPPTTYILYIADYSADRLNETLTALKTDTIKYDYTVNEIFNSPATAESVFSLKISNIDRADSLLKAIP